MRQRSRIIFPFILVLLAGCSSIAPLLSQPTPVPATQPAPTLQSTLTPVVPATSSSRVLRVWLPSRFNPDEDAILQQRLTEFIEAHPELRVEIRVKSEEEGGMLGALAITSTVAPSALPDLVALSRPELESAALFGFLHPVDGLSTVLNNPDWHMYAREMARIQNTAYGLPFFGDALVLLRRSDAVMTNWNEILAKQQSILFPADDSQAVVMLSFYISAGGNLLDDQGQPTLEEKPLTQTLSMIKDGLDANVFSPSLLKFESDEEIFQAYRENAAAAAIVWAAQKEGVIESIPVSGSPNTFTSGWVWALAGASAENQQVAVDLAEYLLEDDFLSEWTDATGFLPVKLNQESTMGNLLESARGIPSNDVLSILGPILNQALARVLSGEQVEDVVRSAMEQIR